MPPLTDDLYNEYLSAYSPDEADIDSSVDHTSTELYEIVCQLSISHPDEIACAGRGLVSARSVHTTSESA